ncbi:hypothetical protein ACQKCU_14360 [Heyndrickxia sporothermodurans]
MIGQFIDKNYGIKEDKKSFLDSDLDMTNKLHFKLKVQVNEARIEERYIDNY